MSSAGIRNQQIGPKFGPIFLMYKYIMRIHEIISEGGWASSKTQSTVLTPALLQRVVYYLQSQIQPRLNAWLNSKNIPSIQFGKPVGSGTYYERHLKTDPQKQYGDIDIQFIIPKLGTKSTNENRQFFYDLIKQYGDSTGAYETDNGKNIVVNIAADDYVQVDLVSLFYDLVDWSTILTPPEGVKGVLSASLYSALAEALNISISDLGIQVKTANNQIVPFSKQKDVELVTISTNKESWAVDLVKFLGCKKLDPILTRYPGMKDEITINQILGSIIGIARTLELNDRLSAAGKSYSSAESLISTISKIYLDKIDKVINSSKFNKATTPEAQALAEKTKKVLFTGSRNIANLFASTI